MISGLIKEQYNITHTADPVPILTTRLTGRQLFLASFLVGNDDLELSDTLLRQIQVKLSNVAPVIRA